MSIATGDLNILAFPQHWDGNAITLRFLCVPRGDPEAALRPGGPAFATADFRFEARLIGGLAHLPRAAEAIVGEPAPLLLDAPPLEKAALFAELRAHFTIAAPGLRPARPAPTIRKPVTASYRALVGDRQLGAGLADPDDYACALHEAHGDQPAEPAIIPVTRSWGEVIAFALRQPKLATALGLSGQTSVVPPAGLFAQGGWLWVGLHASGDLGGVDGVVASFAARIPPLGDAARDLYSMQLFPLDDGGVADEGAADLARHDHGFARLVHATTGDEDGDGIRLAWDDEVVAGELGRQAAGVGTTRPMATAGYRIDVRDIAAADPAWHSLQRIASIGDLTLGAQVVGLYEGEAVVEVVPVQVSPAHPGDFWMPPYFCTWRGASLVLSDADLTGLQQRAAIDPAFAVHRLGREQVFQAVGDKDVPLRYGHRYQFRVRLADLSRGGPPAEAATPEDPTGAAHHIVELDFARRRPPGPVEIVQGPTADARQIALAKPLLRHPEILFTDKHDFAELEAASADDIAAGRQREMGLSDPDVVTLAVRLEVKALIGEAATWLPLYETTRDLDARSLTLRGARAGRWLFGCTNGLRHIPSPDGTSLTLSADADLAQRWITVLQFDLARDWTWDGLAGDGLVVRRTVSRAGQDDVTEIAGTIAVPRSVSRTATVPPDPRDPLRASSHIVFLDAIDPKPKPVGGAAGGAQFPAELTVRYEIGATLRGGVPSPAPSTATVVLPITTPPVQVPKLVSAGIALSPYDAAADYSATRQRERMLWLEFEELPADPQDGYFARVLASAPDPLLIADAAMALSPEPALPIDAETMRRITPGQPRDDNGLSAMQPLQRRAEGSATFLVPLPDGLASNSPELLGMFTYEIRIGHAGANWSTAQGRFGPPLRIAGVQHPPPPLACQAARTAKEIRVRAPFATAVMDGRYLRPNIPKTRLWAVIYARVRQADGAAWRNLMLLRVPLIPPVGDPARPPDSATAPPLLYGEGSVAVADLETLLHRHGLSASNALTTMAVEFLTEPEIADPLGGNLGQARMLRASPLISISDIC